MDRLQPSLGCRATTSVKFYFDTHLKTSENQRLKFKLKPERFTGEKSAENLILSNESKNLSND